MRSIITLLLLACGFILGGCNCQRQPDRITIGTAGIPKDLNPVTSSHSTYSNAVNRYIHLPLMTHDPRTGQLSPLLLTSLPANYPEGLTYNLALQPNITWPNGEEFTIEDVIFSYKVAKLMDKRGTLAAHFTAFEGIEPSPTDRQQGIMTFSACSIYNPYLMAVVPILQRSILDPEKVWDDISWEALKSESTISETTLGALANWQVAYFDVYGSRDKFLSNQSIAGLGPYKLVSWEDDKLILMPIENYWGENLGEERLSLNQTAPSIIFRTFSAKQPQIALTAFETGELDVFTSSEPSLTDEVSPPYLAQTDTAYRWVGLFWNTKPASSHDNDILTDPKVRKALDALIPRHQIAEELYHGAAKPTYSAILSDLPEYLPSPLESQALRDSALYWLEESDWIDRDGDGIREKQVMDLAIPLKLVMICGSSKAQLIAGIIRDSLRKHGIELEIAAKGSASGVIQAIQQAEGNLDIVMMAQRFTTPFDFQQLYSLASPWNISQYGTAQTDSLIMAIHSACEGEQHDALSRQMQAILYKEVPMSFVVALPKTWMVRKAVCKGCLYDYYPYVLPNTLNGI